LWKWGDKIYAVARTVIDNVYSAITTDALAITLHCTDAQVSLSLSPKAAVIALL